MLDYLKTKWQSRQDGHPRACPAAPELAAARREKNAQQRVKLQEKGAVNYGNGKVRQPTKLPHSAFKQEGQLWRRFGVVVPDALWQMAMDADDNFYSNYSQYAHLSDEVTLWNTSQTKMAKGVVRGVDHVTHKVRIKILEQHEFEPPTLGKDNPDDAYMPVDSGFDGFSIIRRADGAGVSRSN